MVWCRKVVRLLCVGGGILARARTPDRHDRLVLGVIPGVGPGVQPPFEGADPFEAFVHQSASHTGRGGFARSGTVEDDLALPRQLAEPVVDLVDRHPQGSGEAPRVVEMG